MLYGQSYRQKSKVTAAAFRSAGSQQGQRSKQFINGERRQQEIKHSFTCVFITGIHVFSELSEMRSCSKHGFCRTFQQRKASKHRAPAWGKVSIFRGHVQLLPPVPPSLLSLGAWRRVTFQGKWPQWSWVISVHSSSADRRCYTANRKPIQHSDFASYGRKIWFQCSSARGWGIEKKKYIHLHSSVLLSVSESHTPGIRWEPASQHAHSPLLSLWQKKRQHQRWSLSQHRSCTTVLLCHRSSNTYGVLLLSSSEGS